MDIDLAALLQASDVMLLFAALGMGLLIGKIRLGGFQLGNTPGVLLAAIALGAWGFDLDAQTESLGFMLFIFCVGIEAGPNFFSNFLQDGARYISIAAIMVVTAVAVTNAVARLLDLDPGLAAGMLAGALTSTPTLVGAQDAVAQQMSQISEEQRSLMISQISVGYAMTYLVGLLGLLLILRYLPVVMRFDPREQAQKLARARGMDSERRRNVRTPILRAYEIGTTSASPVAGQTLREIGIYQRAGLIIERIKRDTELLEPDPDLVLREGDKVALVGYPSSHGKSEIDRSAEVYDPDLLEFRMDAVHVVVANPDMIGTPLSELELENRYGCLIDGVTRAQVELPVDRSLRLDRGDVLEVSGERNRLRKFATKIGSIEHESDISDLMTFSFFFVGGLVLGQFSLLLGELKVTLGNAGGLLLAGILMGFFRARNPMFGYIPQGAINVLKDLGLNIFMVSVGLAAGADILQALMDSGLTVLLGGACIMLVPLTVGYGYGSLVLKMNPILLLGALTGAMTSTPALKTLNEMSDSAVPALGYAGTYTFANVFLTLGGAS
ncbi:MAG: transporter, partial [Gammaproteobacteria bacterium]|nr:transporter [Gammaproteobacteria bacterium]